MLTHPGGDMILYSQELTKIKNKNRAIIVSIYIKAAEFPEFLSFFSFRPLQEKMIIRYRK